MGVIIRQSLKTSVVNYAAVAVGAFSTVFIYPLEKEVYGLAQFLMSTGMLIMPFIIFGATYVNIQYFPIFRNEENRHSGFWSFLHLLVLGGTLVSLLFLGFFWENIMEQYDDKSELLQIYLPYAIPLSILIGLTRLNGGYAANFQRTAIPALFYSYIKISLPILVLLFHYQYITVHTLVLGVLLTYVAGVISSITYIGSLDGLSFKINWPEFDRDRMKAILTYAGFGALSGAGSAIAFRIDGFMIPSLTDLKSNGVYAISLFIGNAIAIPAQAIVGIAGPIISDHLKKEEYDEVRHIYKRASDNLLLIGLGLFFLVILSVSELFSLMPKSEEMIGGWWVVLFIGITKLVEMATSTNHQIINYSRYYRYNLYAIFILATLNVVLNYILIQSYGIVGAAMATLIALTTYNFSKVGFIYFKFGLQPFSLVSLKLIFTATIIGGLVYLVPVPDQAVFAIAIRSLLFGALYFAVSYYLRLSPEGNDLIEKVWKRVFK